MRRLLALGLPELIRSRAAEGVPVLGICLGMQVLLERSDELQPTDGLGLIRGAVTRLDTRGLRVPHIGWNEVTFERPSPLTAGLPSGGCPFYHVHSLAARPDDPDDVVATTEYGERFATIVAHGSVFGVQFHPEKSSAHGLRMLESFIDVCADPSAVAARTAATRA
jgi:glutamine amidotransferase